MTKGALIFAFNNESVDYVKMASWSAANIHRHLGIPVAVVTDVDHVPNADRVIKVNTQGVDTRYFEDLDQTVTWYNQNRVDAFGLTPWDQTLLLDADYVVASRHLEVWLDSDRDFICYNRAVDVSTNDDTDCFMPTFGTSQMKMSWATVIMFKRNAVSQYIFDCMTMIRNNWQHYRDLYGIQQKTYRNDFALSIALGIVNGHSSVCESGPSVLFTVTPNTMITQCDQDEFIITWSDRDSKPKTSRIKGVDLHVMGKRWLGEIIAAH